jgi:hypothetical protein
MTRLQIVEEIKHLDFTLQTPCEYSLHKGLDHGADLLISASPKCCGRPTFTLGVCFAVWYAGGTEGLHCNSCHHYGPRAYFWSILKVLS